MKDNQPYKATKFDLFENNKPLMVGTIIGIILLIISISYSVYKRKHDYNTLISSGVQTDAQIIGVWRLNASKSTAIYMFDVSNDIYTGDFTTSGNILLNQKITILYEPKNPNNSRPK